MKCTSKTLAIAALLLAGGCMLDSAAIRDSSGSGSGATRARSAWDGSRIALIDSGAEDGGEDSDDAGEPASTMSAKRGPYYEAAPWKGYFWVAKTGKSTTVVPSTHFTAAKFDSRVCVQGSVPPSSDSGANAMLGVNINQAKRVDAIPHTLVPSRAGVLVKVTNPGGSPLRVQVAAPDGTTNAQSRWCATVNGSGGFVPWTDFNTACWDGSGRPYEHEHISVAMLLVPGNTKSPVPYDFCLQRLAEVDGADSGGW